VPERILRSVAIRALLASRQRICPISVFLSIALAVGWNRDVLVEFKGKGLEFEKET
jgi:hypothetical protein